MGLFRAAAVAACALAAAGCVKSEASFETYRQSLASDKAAYDKEFGTCVKQVQGSRHAPGFATLINKPIEQTPSIICARLLNALRDGALSYKDYADAAKGVPTPKLVRVMQGR